MTFYEKNQLMIFLPPHIHIITNKLINQLTNQLIKIFRAGAIIQKLLNVFNFRCIQNYICQVLKVSFGLYMIVSWFLHSCSYLPLFLFCFQLQFSLSYLHIQQDEYVLLMRLNHFLYKQDQLHFLKLLALFSHLSNLTNNEQ